MPINEITEDTFELKRGEKTERITLKSFPAVNGKVYATVWIEGRREFAGEKAAAIHYISDLYDEAQAYNERTGRWPRS
jgi:hypothetical protein